jgi:hypothetical protein
VEVEVCGAVPGAVVPVAGWADSGAGAAPGFAAAGAGAFCAAAFAGTPWMTEFLGRASRIESTRDSTTKPTNAPVVSLWRNVVAPRAPKAV